MGVWNARETAGAKMEELKKCLQNVSHGVWHEREVQAVEGRWGCGLTLQRENLTRLKKLNIELPYDPTMSFVGI